jgi:hypothetical protein
LNGVQAEPQGAGDRDAAARTELEYSPAAAFPASQMKPMQSSVDTPTCKGCTSCSRIASMSGDRRFALSRSASSQDYTSDKVESSPSSRTDPE